MYKVFVRSLDGTVTLYDSNIPNIEEAEYVMAEALINFGSLLNDVFMEKIE